MEDDLRKRKNLLIEQEMKTFSAGGTWSEGMAGGTDLK